MRQNLHFYLQQEEVVKPADLMQLFALVNVLGKDQNELLTIYPFMIAKVHKFATFTLPRCLIYFLMNGS